MSACNCMGCPHPVNCRCRCPECNAPQYGYPRFDFWPNEDERIRNLEEEVRRLREVVDGPESNKAEVLRPKSSKPQELEETQ